MKGFSRTLAVSLAALVMLSAASFALADTGQTNQTNQTPQGNDMPVSVQSDSGKLIVQNQAITIWFQGYKPVLHIFQRNASGNSTGFTVAIRGVYELNSTNVPVAVLPMTRAFPEIEDNSSGPFNYSSAVIVQNDTVANTVNITFTLTANEFKVMPMMSNQDNAVSSDMTEWSSIIAGQASVAVVFHINETTAHVKFDFLVNNWTWVNSVGDRLALNAVILGHQTARDSSGQRPTDQGTSVGEDSSSTATSSAVPATAQPASVQAHEDNVSIVGQNFVKLGYVSWGRTANVTYANGTGTIVSVNMTMFSHGMTEEDSNYTSFLFIFDTPAGWNTNYSSLAYDPTVGLTATASSFLTPQVVALGAAVAVLAAIGAVVVLRRRL